MNTNNKIKSEHQKCFFELKKVTDKKRKDYRIVNWDYKNLLLFTYKYKVYSFNFCTLHFYLMDKIVFKRTKKTGYNYEDFEETVYKAIEKLNGEIPANFKSYNYGKQYRKDRIPQIVETYKSFCFVN